jgi:hypothetical protein
VTDATPTCAAFALPAGLHSLAILVSIFNLSEPHSFRDNVYEKNGTIQVSSLVVGGLYGNSTAAPANCVCDLTRTISLQLINIAYPSFKLLFFVSHKISSGKYGFQHFQMLYNILFLIVIGFRLLFLDLFSLRHLENPCLKKEL